MSTAPGLMIIDILKQIVEEAKPIVKDLTPDPLFIDFVDIFPKSEKERTKLIKEAETIAQPIQNVSTGRIYRLYKPLRTQYGELTLIKIRIRDKTRKQRGAPDFKVKKYFSFKKKALEDPRFKLIIRKNYEMMELKEGNIAIYFPSETLSETLRG